MELIQVFYIITGDALQISCFELLCIYINLDHILSTLLCDCISLNHIFVSNAIYTGWGCTLFFHSFDFSRALTYDNRTLNRSLIDNLHLVKRQHKGCTIYPKKLFFHFVLIVNPYGFHTAQYFNHSD